MPKVSSPYKSNIWSRDERYDFDRVSLTDDDYETIRRLGMVDIAKKQVPPVPALGLLVIHKAIKRLPTADTAGPEEVLEFLNCGLALHGAGIPTLICMLAVESKGDYAPMDRKFASGMLVSGVISTSEHRHLCGKEPMAFSSTYVSKVIPAWRKSRATRDPEEADIFWGNGGQASP